MNIKSFFTECQTPLQRQYEALRALYLEELNESEVAQRFGISLRYLRKTKTETAKLLKAGQIPFFIVNKPGPKGSRLGDEVKDSIISLRKKNKSIEDIKSHLDAKGHKTSQKTIHRILAAEGFARLPKRTRMERKEQEYIHDKPPIAQQLVIENEEFITTMATPGLILLPLIHKLGIEKAINACNFPGTSAISNISYLLSLLALKLAGGKRWSHDEKWCFDRGLGLFAGLNVLPKNASLSSYSYRVTREMNRTLLSQLAKIFSDSDLEQGDFNLDFKSIPHWGDDSVLSKHWCGARSKAMKSILSLFVQDPDSGFISYTDAEIQKGEVNNCVVEFVDFWKESRGISPKMLIFDARFTTYENLSKLNQDGIKFITLRRRGKNLVERAEKIPEEQWRYIKVEGEKRKYKRLRIFEEEIALRGYQGKLRQVIITENGREDPAFLILNDFDLPLERVVRKYARRWLVEKEISEHVNFFHLNSPSSSIVIKVDFDLTLTVLAHNIYRVLAKKLPGFENSEVPTLARKFLETIARVKISDDTATVFLKKKNHMPLLFAVDFMQEETFIPWIGLKIRFRIDTTS